MSHSFLESSLEIKIVNCLYWGDYCSEWNWLRVLTFLKKLFFRILFLEWDIDACCRELHIPLSVRIHCNEDTYISTMFLYLSKELISEVPCHTEFLIFPDSKRLFQKAEVLSLLCYCHCCWGFCLFSWKLGSWISVLLRKKALSLFCYLKIWLNCCDQIHYIHLPLSLRGRRVKEEV